MLLFITAQGKVNGLGYNEHCELFIVNLAIFTPFKVL